MPSRFINTLLLLLVTASRGPWFTKQFDAILKAASVPMQRLTAYSPNLNSYIERWIQSIKHECLDPRGVTKSAISAIEHSITIER